MYKSGGERIRKRGRGRSTGRKEEGGKMDRRVRKSCFMKLTLDTSMSSSLTFKLCHQGKFICFSTVSGPQLLKQEFSIKSLLGYCS